MALTDVIEMEEWPENTAEEDRKKQANIRDEIQKQLILEQFQTEDERKKELSQRYTVIFDLLNDSKNDFLRKLLEEKSFTELLESAKAVDLNNDDDFYDIWKLFAALKNELKAIDKSAENNFPKTDLQNNSSPVTNGKDFATLTNEFQSKAQLKSAEHKALSSAMFTVSVFVTVATTVLALLPLILIEPLFPKTFEKFFSPVEKSWDKTEELWERGNTWSALSGKFVEVKNVLEGGPSTKDSSSKKESSWGSFFRGLLTSETEPSSPQSLMMRKVTGMGAK